MRTLFLAVFLTAVFSLGCARVKVEAPEKPIKVDITMRLDIYQHVQKDIDAIEDIVSGGAAQEKAKKGGNSSWLHLAGVAFAEEALSPEVEAAALRRRDRLAELNSLQARGIVGEDRSGLVQVRKSGEASPGTRGLVSAENSDRMAIYASIAKKNNTSVDEVQKIYAKRLQDNAPSGTPIEAFVDSSGRYEWQIKP
ncbi:MAG: YnbE family lipoprotein [Candidatus Omnitrophica bacterium]|nr:YnbE family lipoprotein [Candidatus Omnitrophota bacterium]